MNEIIKKNGITFGVLNGIFSILITLYAYIFDLELFGSLWLLFFIIVFFLALNITLLVKTKKALNNNFSFKDAFTTYFICLVIGITISVFFNIILFNIIDTELGEKVKQVTMESSANFMKKFGASAEDIKVEIEKISKSDNFSILSQIKGFFTNIAVSSIFGLILAAIFKIKPTYQE